MVLFVDNGEQVQALKQALERQESEQAKILLERVKACEALQVGKVKCADKKVRHSKKE